MKVRTFTTIDNEVLVVKHRKSAVILETEEVHADKKIETLFQFDQKEFVELIHHFRLISEEAWTAFEPKVSDSLGSDYYEYYDRKLDNNGYLSLRENGLSIERPMKNEKRLYQFNKRKMESFLFDAEKDLILKQIG